MAISKIKTGSITDSAITSAKISDGTIVNADVSPSAAIVASKTVIRKTASCNLCAVTPSCRYVALALNNKVIPDVCI